MTSHYLPVVELTRGTLVESVHFGAVAVVDSNGTLLTSFGDPDSVTYLRSSAKPFQALPFIEMGGDKAFNLTDKEIALICASHSGTDEHLAVVQRMQQKIGVSEKNLLCGTHSPTHQPTAKAMLLRGEEPTPNRHNCSGKHTGMLALAILRHLPLEDYININHPLQQTILNTFAEMCGLSVNQVVVGIDGCSAPNFAVPLRNAAWGYARLCDPSQLTPARAHACQGITRAMTQNSDMVGGPGRFDTVIMKLTEGRLLTKGGAEGYLGMGLMAGAIFPGSPALGITIKISDGDSGGRAVPCVAVEILRQLGVISNREQSALDAFGAHPLLNYRGIQVGEIRPCFELTGLSNLLRSLQPG
jgi:L-asparaginase II